MNQLGGPRVALAGGNEFRAGSRAADTRLLELAGGPDTPVAVLPTAAALQRPDKAAETGIRHFQNLGARQAKSVMIVDRASVDDPGLVEQLRAARLIYLTGGDPRHLHQVLAGSSAWTAIRDAASAGSIIVGSSAGAMVLSTPRGGNERFAGVGLGLVRGYAVLVHHRGPARVDLVPGGPTLLGLAEETTFLRDGNRWQNLGCGTVWVYQPGRQPEAVEPGATWNEPPGSDRSA